MFKKKKKKVYQSFFVRFFSFTYLYTSQFKIKNIKGIYAHIHTHTPKRKKKKSSPNVYRYFILFPL